MTSNDDRTQPDKRDRWSEDEFGSVLDAAKVGADWAWRRLVEHYSPSLLGYARLRGAVEPEDVVSEVWMAAATGIQRFDGDEPSFRSWLFVIGHRRTIDASRRDARHPRPADPIHLEDLSTRQATSAESLALDVVASEELEGLLSLLTSDQRDVITLRIIADLSLKETARVIGKRVGAVKALQHRALESLRQEIESRAYPNGDS